MTTGLSRRTLLQAAGVSLGLPLMEAMQISAAEANESKVARAVFIYVPNGVNIHQWVPNQVGRDFSLSPTLNVLKDFKANLSVISQSCHPNSKGGHSGADTWLTAADLAGTPGFDYRNSISIDRAIAAKTGLITRIPSLELSSHGGTGQPGHSQTLSFSDQGIPIPAEKNPRALFERLFSEGSMRYRKDRLQRIAEDKSVLDAILSQAKRLERSLSKPDQRKLEEYLTAVREVESRVQRSEKWMDIPKPRIDARQFSLQTKPDQHGGSQPYFRLMLDLVKLAFKTDSTRVCTFQFAREAHPGFVQDLPVKANHHELSHHGGDKKMLEGLFVIDKYYLEQLRYFLAELASIQEDESNLLNRTMIIYGSGMNSGIGGGHSAKNLPMLFAGGSDFGIGHGQHLSLPDQPISNLYATIYQQMGLGVGKFADSTGTIRELLVS